MKVEFYCPNCNCASCRAQNHKDASTNDGSISTPHGASPSSRGSAAVISGVSSSSMDTEETRAIDDLFECWEAERKSRELMYLGDSAGLRVPRAIDEHENSVDEDNCEFPDDLDPDEWRFECKGLPHKQSATLFVPSRSRSSRASREFGTDRFIFVRDSGKQPAASFEFLNRQWRCVAWRSEQVIYFAECGPGLKKIASEQVMDKLVPQSLNPEMTLLKYNQRLLLSFSQTRCFPRVKVQQVDDFRDLTGDHILTDGCGSIAPWFAEKITHMIGLHAVPSAFQGRCGPFKGLWVVDPAMSEPEGPQLSVRHSQCKYAAEDSSGVFDFELMQYSRNTCSAVLTSDFIQALEGRGVPVEAFLSLQLQWANTYGHAILNEDNLEDFLAEPPVKSTFLPVLSRYLDAGMPWNEPNFESLRRRFFFKQCRLMSKELRLPLHQGARLWIVPDITRTLSDGECFVQLRGRREPLLGLPILLLRSPCYHTSHVLKLKVCDVVPDGLQHLHDVVVLSASAQRQGPSDAELMCGDYDGDQALIIWDRQFTEPVSEAPPHVRCDPEEPPHDLAKVGETTCRELPERLLSLFPPAAVSYQNFKRLCCLRKDWAEGEHGFGAEVEGLTRLCLRGVDCISTGVTVEIPKEFNSPKRPHWTGKRSMHEFRSDKACGRLYGFDPEDPPRIEDVQLLEAKTLQMGRWSRHQFLEAMSCIEIVCQELDERIRAIKNRPLAAIFKRDAEYALKHNGAGGIADNRTSSLPEGLRAAAAYAVYVNVRANSRNLETTEKGKADAMLRSYLHSARAGDEEDESCMSAPVRLTNLGTLWDLFERDILNMVTCVTHGPCSNSFGEEFLLDPAVDIRFSHKAISPDFRNGKSLQESLKALLMPEGSHGSLRKRHFPMMRVRWYHGRFYTMSNRRLALFRLFKFHLPPNRCCYVRVVRASDEEARRWQWREKFEVRDTGGKSVYVRGLECTIGETAEDTTFKMAM